MDLVSKSRQELPSKKHKTGFRGPSPDVGKATQIKPGEVRNPKGRGKDPVMTKIYEEIFADPVQRERIKRETARTMARKGMAGVLERREAADRLEGKVAQVVEAEIHLSLSETIKKARERVCNSQKTS